jgi:hypothetical protein
MKTILGLTLVLLSLGASAQRRLGRPTVETFQQLAELTGTQPLALVSFSVAVSGNTLVIGAPDADGFEGAAYVYTAVNGDWSNLQLTATLTQSSGQATFGAFASAVAISGDTIVVGGYDSTTELGAAYIYISPSGNVTENAELTVSGVPSALTAIAFDGGTIVAGSPLTSLGNGIEQGAAFVFVEPAGGWVNMTQTAQLAANDESAGAEFGNSVGISGRTVVVGAPRAGVDGLRQRGRAYIFVEPAAGWSGTQGQTTELEPSDGLKEAYFGYSVSASGGNVVVGAPQQTVGANGTQGAVYVYTAPSTGWPKTMTETAELTASSGKAGSELGYSVAISDTTLLAGAPFAHSHYGVVYVFSEATGGWQSGPSGVAISASDGAPNNVFGNAVGVGGGVLAVSAVGWPNGSTTTADGAVYVFGPVQ